VYKTKSPIDRNMDLPYYAVLGGVEIGTGTLSQVTQPERAGCVVYPPSHRRS